MRVSYLTLTGHSCSERDPVPSNAAINVQRRVQRGLDVKAKREKIEKMDKRPEGVEAPPYVVVVQGPPGCGKTTLIRSLVKHYTKTTLGATIEGSPITVVSGRNRRLTFIECPANDMRAMIDLAKVADLVLLMVDAVRGFEMETFEFINIMQVHGFPRILGILTHLDGFKESKSIRKMKKRYKARFWAELYDGAKMFYLSGIQYSGTRYNKTEVTNLARFIAIQKFAPLSWRQNHSYLVAHRWEDQTLVPDSDTRTLALYGYVSGSRLRTEGQAFHIAGVGDFPAASATVALDPCPPPTNQNPKMKGLALRTLSDKQRNLYAPYCEHQHITVDSEAMYINTREAEESFTRKEEEDGSTDDEEAGEGMSSDDDEEEEMDPSEAVKMVRELQDVKLDLNDRDAPLPLVAGGAAVPPTRRLAEEEDEEEVISGRRLEVGNLIIIVFSE
ncbi:ribosome biogenesis protein bms1, putative [Perkinsus marinus ATCC 50983]|uniref:Ribosome biogenesis protein bms1, putative n=1 Tax=Perkinsus marinus (strain ATCC 50983 / TXsc) TaxID=423536 RepID=C5KA86_PERM5|nr:ribosome biogenesis protein bms1, putative [Perkinsus marinus ATCC 50983]EER18547.1 ribosome biogenesis protein bms1, putative [Perkinsus marinus ATCC 50983]|eukprot:XP_002786751.1 ribosome biogenesis protein bms1, putative [Perkinsus marinus ATCC 50983]